MSDEIVSWIGDGADAAGDAIGDIGDYVVSGVGDNIGDIGDYAIGAGTSFWDGAVEGAGNSVANMFDAVVGGPSNWAMPKDGAMPWAGINTGMSVASGIKGI
jgi:hypothetical protein